MFKHACVVYNYASLFMYVGNNHAMNNNVDCDTSCPSNGVEEVVPRSCDNDCDTLKRIRELADVGDSRALESSQIL